MDDGGSGGNDAELAGRIEDLERRLQQAEGELQKRIERNEKRQRAVIKALAFSSSMLSQEMRDLLAS